MLKSGFFWKMSLFIGIILIFSFSACEDDNDYNGTPGLAFYQKGINGYSVSRGKATATEVVIPSEYNGKSVFCIEGKGFENYSNLINISIPGSVIELRLRAFSGCINLASITIPNNMKVIGDEAFYNCNNLISITIPSSVTTTGKNVFYGCINLTSVTFESNYHNFYSASFPGDLSEKYSAGGIGTYTRSSGSNNTWTKQ